jgi:hypothetical protein
VTGECTAAARAANRPELGIVQCCCKVLSVDQTLTQNYGRNDTLMPTQRLPARRLACAWCKHVLDFMADQLWHSCRHQRRWFLAGAHAYAFTQR